MSFILNLLSFLLIVFGILFCTVSSPNNQELVINKIDKSKLTQEQLDKVYRLLTKVRAMSFSAVILGIGIIIAKIFS
jgi:vacuolar-type H+-ATPase subunit I/STV1